ncbi:MAG: dihydroorotate dehydrogenase electron transfer subunit [Elusimicrobia bacterium]|nr:dihydroorotate dehydrogenase electron transfer subunit [Candidatus Liberimonas magnetica]
MYKVIGKGTESLASLKKGQSLNLLGPLGNGYEIPPAKNKIPVLISGGVGIASLAYLAKKLPAPGILFYGTQSKKDIVGLEIFKKKKWQIKLSTMDGTAGFKGFVTDLCRESLDRDTCSTAVIYSCGPKPMLKSAARTAKELGVECFVSLEEMMACGVGICQGCVVKTNEGYRKVCDDGPVFNADKIDWESLTD